MSIDRISLCAFLELYGIFMRPEDLDSVFRRLDHDGDEALNYSEFVQALMPSRNFDDTRTTIKRESGSPLRGTSSPLRAGNRTPNELNFSTPSD